MINLNKTFELDYFLVQFKKCKIINDYFTNILIILFV